MGHGRWIAWAVAGALVARAATVCAGTLFVANNGVDGGGCSKAVPCRSISHAIAVAAAGDKIVVGPGVYGDLLPDGNLDDPGEETGSPGCSCMLSINKAVSITSSDGAAATVIDARSVAVGQAVLFIANGGELGKPGKGFTVTNPKTAGADGIVIDSNGVAVRGNLVTGGVELGQSSTGDGIATVNSAGVVLVEGNLVTGWDDRGIRAQGTGTTVRKNLVMRNNVGIGASGAAVVTGNVASANFINFLLSGAATVVGNAARGGGYGFRAGGLTGLFEKNDLFGNGCGVANDASPSPLLAANNYWGAATGPGADPADTTCTDAITTTPFAIKPFGVKVKFK